MKKTYILKDYDNIKEMIINTLNVKKEIVALSKNEDDLRHQLSIWNGYLDCLMDMGLLTIEQWSILNFDGVHEIIESYFKSRN